jgi:hypothetical protein
MPLKSDTVEAASRTLLLLGELNRHRVTSIDSLVEPRSSGTIAALFGCRFGLSSAQTICVPKLCTDRRSSERPFGFKRPTYFTAAGGYL